ncbi:MAG: phosphoribosylglycinamide formyltransferase [Firmicutes bacterium]|nr:phosphoribosylglycinamide formyltransferase [Bacillota bacterium]
MGRLAVLVSGRGSNLQALIDAVHQKKLNASIVSVISDRTNAYGLQRAQIAGIPTKVFPWLKGGCREDYFQQIADYLEDLQIDLVVLAGFMRVLSPNIVAQFPNRIINIHPSLLPAFPGLNAQRQALEYGVKFTGCTVHFVDEGVDSGPILVQKVVPIQPDDTEETLAKRILDEEHIALPEAVELALTDNWRIQGRRVI